MLKFVTTLIIAAITVAGAASAQTTTPPKPATVNGGGSITTVSPEKEKLIQRILQLWPVENVGLVMLQRPVAESIRQSRSLLQGRVSSELQEAAMKDIGQDAKKFLEDAAPVVNASAHKLIPTTVVPILAEKFSEEELRQIVAILESPVKAKFEAAAPEIEKALGEKIAAETGATINPKLGKLTEDIGLRMRTAITPQ
jgi:hypothetical protein